MASRSRAGCRGIGAAHHRSAIIVAKGKGRLEVIATPIGNLADLSDRARHALAEADIILAEDTRRTRALLQSLGIARPLLSVHEHNEGQRLPELLTRLAAGERLALVSDAGMPLLSDPGASLVREAARAGCEVSVVPGPSAITAALAVAALPTERFCFEGFLPAAPRERRARLAELAHEPRTLVLFEAPHRILECLADLAEILGAARPAAMVRELTKVHESVYRGTLGELAGAAGTDPDMQRGEITLVVQGAPAAAPALDQQLLERAVALLAPELPPGRAAAIVAQLTGAKRNDVYALILAAGGRKGG